ncbi:5'-AMP-activated protein kinase subunit beta-2 [Smittium culicis]|uniref:5'-AMP-activated protein kinase subunit beta-2 n=1 Tax=Smittium culicis TaxID=133412 RepID=A0A1R1YI81_9FUNG|nr:5'-AMP-activated protein kinase subunit beta-2 [Smittium culicis]
MGNTHSSEMRDGSRRIVSPKKSRHEVNEDRSSPQPGSFSERVGFRRLRTASSASNSNKKSQFNPAGFANHDDGIFGLGMASGSPVVGSPLFGSLAYGGGGTYQSSKRQNYKLPRNSVQHHAIPINQDSFPETYADQSALSSYIKQANNQISSSMYDNNSFPTGMDIESSKRNDTIVPTLIKWDEPADVVDTGDWSTLLNLPVGMHRLKFIVDGEWQYSKNLVIAPDDNGNLVNYIKIEDVLININEENDASDNVEGLDSVTLSDSPPGEYRCSIPDTMHNRYTQEIRSQRTDPPTLPPHLNQVLLNQPETNINGIRSLPAPNHVVLNHLYRGFGSANGEYRAVAEGRIAGGHVDPEGGASRRIEGKTGDEGDEDAGAGDDDNSADENMDADTGADPAEISE